MAKIIKFPNTMINQLSNAQKLAMEMQAEKNMYEDHIGEIMKAKDWDKLPKIDGRALEMLALFGDVMTFTPEISSRLISKLAEQIKRNEVYDPLEEYLP
tara:strand:+ start:129 stop:425 length:297 start_codon:yes stop_codon:yes gene_type:complete